MIVHVLYVLTLILFLFILFFFVRKNKEFLASASKPEESEVKKSDNLFSVLFYFAFGANVILFAMLSKQSDIFNNCFTSLGGSSLFLLMLDISGIMFISEKYDYDRYGKYDENHPKICERPKIKRKSIAYIYNTAFLLTSIIVSLFSSYVLFALIKIKVNIDKIPANLLMLILFILGIYQIAVSIYRIFNKGKKDVSYISFFISVAVLFVYSYCYSFLLDYYFFSIAGMNGPITIFGLTIFVVLILNVVIYKKVEKTCYKDKTQLRIKDGFCYFQIANIIGGVVLPLASVIFFVLDYFHLIMA